MLAMIHVWPPVVGVTGREPDAMAPVFQREVELAGDIEGSLERPGRNKDIGKQPLPRSQIAAL
jgi:hypothetical protein